MRSGSTGRILRRIGFGLGILAIAFVSLLAGVGIGASGASTERIVEKKVEVPVEVVKVVTQVVEVPVEVERIVKVPEVVERVVTVEVEKVVEVTPTPTPTPEGPRIELVDNSLEYRIQEQNDLWWKFAYQFTLRNNTDRNIDVGGIHIKFVDAEGFVVDDAYLWNVAVPANESRVFSDSTLIDAEEASKITGIQIERT